MIFYAVRFIYISQGEGMKHLEMDDVLSINIYTSSVLDTSGRLVDELYGCYTA